MPVNLRDAATAIEDFLRAIGLDPAHDLHLQSTGDRVARLFLEELLDGYQSDPRLLLEEGQIASSGTQLPAIVMLVASPTHLVCPHHLTVGAGFASVAFEPQNAIVGLGTLARLIDAHTHRLVLQEDAGQQIVDDLVGVLGARGAVCQLEIEHGCLTHHAPKKPKAKMVTRSIAGAFTREPPSLPLNSP